MWIRRIELQLMQPVGLFWVNAHPLTAGLGPQKYKDYGEAQRRRAQNRMLWLSDEIARRDFIAGAAFTMADILAEAGLHGARVRRKLRFRYALSWIKPS